MTKAIASRSRTVLHLSAVLCPFILVACRAPDNPSGPDPATGVPAVHTHEVSGETCFICDPAKRDTSRLWCGEHGRYEDRCFICHPELREPGRAFCAEHFLYEDECFLCHPELAAPAAAAAETPTARVAFEETASLAPAAGDRPKALFCEEHRVYEHECGICRPDMLGRLTVGQGVKVRFSSSESVRKAGVRTGHASIVPITLDIQALGELSYNRNRLAVVVPYASGVVREVYVDVGQVVEAGQLLAEVNSPMVADAKSALVKALADQERLRLASERERRLVEGSVASRQNYEATQAAYAVSVSEVKRARQQLLNLGLTEVEVEAVEKDRSTSSVLPLRAPFAGVVVERDAVLGAATDAGSPLFRIADLSTMWFELSLPEQDAVRTRPGVVLEAEFDALPGESFEGQITWIAPRVNEFTRTVQARATIPNPDLRLKSGLFGRARIREAIVWDGLTVSAEAVQVVEGRSIVFAKLEDDLFETRIVKTGPVFADRVSVLEGLSPNEEIAVSETYVLKSELLKARLGAGCVND